MKSQLKSKPVPAKGVSITSPNSQLSPLAMWGGVECTVNRVGDRYFSQMHRNGHIHRLSDLDLFAGLGVRALRYPVLWELVAPYGPSKADWSWPDERLGRLKDLGIRPIVGLLHHGSGPLYTSLIDPAFPQKLADYARAVAERYPWVDAYTPINEPLTTSRFSGLYGHWYPHGKTPEVWIRTLLNEIHATVLAMRAIREINPRAQLIQTEDMGHIFSTPLLAYQAEFENERRFLSLDLLCGRIGPKHPLWTHLQAMGVTLEDVESLRESPCPPDIIGINHYVTSDRFLDEKLSLYPEAYHGGNGKHRYADIEAIRVGATDSGSPRFVLEQTWERYGLPLVVSEAHLGATREEQIRWLKDIWDMAEGLHRRGMDLRAVTAWSLLGSHDWDCLVTRERGHYEPGVFELRNGLPYPTALASAVRTLARGERYDHPVCDARGWWKRKNRLIYSPEQMKLPKSTIGARGSAPDRHTGRPLLITGATGTLGSAFARICEVRGVPYRLVGRKDMDIANAQSVDKLLGELAPWAVVNAAGYVRVDDAERERQACFRENLQGPSILAQACARFGARLVTFSSDLVFDGKRSTPYAESCPVAPLNVYGESKAQAEQEVQAVQPSALIIRTAAFFGPWDRHNFAAICLKALEEEGSFMAAEDAWVSPTYVPDLVNTCLDLLIDDEKGVWHVANRGGLSWLEFARLIAKRAGFSPEQVVGRKLSEMQLPAPRPSYSVLTSERGLPTRSLEEALDRYFDSIRKSSL